MELITSDDGSLTAFSENYQQTFHSRFGALSEARQVYLENSGVAKRLARGTSTRVLEIGFGLGLNFLTTATYALRHNTPLHYTGIENDLISPDVLNDLRYAEHKEISVAVPILQNLLAADAAKRRSVAIQSPPVSVEVLKVDAEVVSLPKKSFDAIYLDAFSPEANPELWTPTFLCSLFQALCAGGNLATYCVKGSVRRNLASTGFRVQKLPGPKGKREVLIATREL